MSGQHTPGPWVIDPRHYWDKEITIEQRGDGWNRLRCEVDYDDCDHETAEANARLIAAAPELLDALVSVRKVLNAIAEHPKGDEDDCQAAGIAIRLIDATTAKATGATT